MKLEKEKKTEAVKVKEPTKAEAVVAQHEKQAEADNMKRQLTAEELDKTNNGIARLEKELEELNETMDYNQRTIEFQKEQDKYQDLVRPYIRKKREEESTKAMLYFEQDMKSKADTLNTLKDHVINGVEVKKGAD